MTIDPQRYIDAEAKRVAAGLPKSSLSDFDVVIVWHRDIFVQIPPKPFSGFDWSAIERALDRKECPCSQFAWTKKTKSNGSICVRGICVECGSFTEWVKRSLCPLHLDEMPELDAMSDARQEFVKALWHKRKHGWWDKYEAHLESDEWKALRVRVFNRDRLKCRVCEDALAEHCHHINYDRMGNEDLADLLSVCGLCHDVIHILKDRRHHIDGITRGTAVDLTDENRAAFFREVRILSNRARTNDEHDR